MSLARLVLAGLRHHARMHLLLAAGCALAAAVLAGALCVGDSVRGTLERQALARIGQVDLALDAGGRRFRAALAEELERALPDARAAPVLRLAGVASARGGVRRAREVAVLGIDARFLALAPEPYAGEPPARGRVLLNERLARQLELAPGEELLLRVERPSALSRDLVLANVEEDSFAFSARVAAVLDERSFGRFALETAQLPPYTAFVDLEFLQAELQLEGLANLLLLAGRADPARLVESANAGLREHYRLADVELELVERSDPACVELLSPRVFLDEEVVRALGRIELPLSGVLTYFVNALRKGERSTPYSTVASLGMLREGVRAPPELAALLPADLGDDEIVIGEWLAQDLEAQPGEWIEVAYFVPGPDRRLTEEARRLRVRAVVPRAGLAADATLMPDFPGITDSASCRDWDPGVPIDLDAIRPQDERYWEELRGTPKAFVSLATGRSMWRNRFGSLTAARAPVGSAAELERALRAELEPAALGLFFRDLRAQALAAGDSATDFGGLFLGLSSFLIGAALLLTALLFAFGVEQRARELGTLLALGFRAREVRRVLLGEVLLAALAGSCVGALAGLLYARGVLSGLATIWREAVASAPIAFHARPLSLAIGACVVMLAALCAARLALRDVLRREPVELLASVQGERVRDPRLGARRTRRALALGVACSALALLLGLRAAGASGAEASAIFFGAGAAALAGSLAFAHLAIARSGGHGLARSVAGLGRRNAARRPGRSLAAAALLACGSFLVLSIGAHRRSGAEGAEERSSGTGGFAFLGRSSLPVHERLDTARGRETYGLRESELEGVGVVSLRVREGDDASCRSLATPQAPELLGVDPEELARRGAFRFAAVEEHAGAESPWRLLDAERADGAVPVIADQASVQWMLHQRLGGELELVDERGRPFRARIVATLAGSILQGSLVLGERAFQERFPSLQGYRAFLVDAPAASRERAGAALSRALSDVGLELVPSALRLAELNAVQNSYLDVFQVLGGLGLLLGSLGLGVVLLRNAHERRRELALLAATGFQRRDLCTLLFTEHALLLLLGLGAGALCSAIALLAALRAGNEASPLAPAGAILAGLLVAGCLWVLLAGWLATRGRLLDLLRSE